MDETDSRTAPSAFGAEGSFSSWEVARYVQAMSVEMAAMAAGAGLTRLAAGLQVISAICEAELADQS